MGIGGDSERQHSAEELSTHQSSTVLGLSRGLARWYLEEAARAQAMMQRGKAGCSRTSQSLRRRAQPVPAALSSTY